MSLSEKRVLRYGVRALFFWLVPFALVLKKAVFFLYIRVIRSMRLRARAADSVPTYPMS